jgi:hypothetical protein
MVKTTRAGGKHEDRFAKLVDLADKGRLDFDALRELGREYRVCSARLSEHKTRARGRDPGGAALPQRAVPAGVHAPVRTARQDARAALRVLAGGAAGSARANRALAAVGHCAARARHADRREHRARGRPQCERDGAGADVSAGGVAAAVRLAAGAAEVSRASRSADRPQRRVRRLAVRAQHPRRDALARGRHLGGAADGGLAGLQRTDSRRLRRDLHAWQ